MDPLLCEGSCGKLWSGVVEVHPDAALITLARLQSVRLMGPALEPLQKVTLYDVKESQGSESYVLDKYIPSNDMVDLTPFKEVTSGIGGIGMRAKYLGMKCLALLDINDMVALPLRQMVTSVSSRATSTVHRFDIVFNVMKRQEVGSSVASHANPFPPQET
jgi:hypothetical protein